MAQSKSVLDKYTQFAVLKVAGLAAMTGTVVTQIVTGLTNNQKIGWEVGRVEYDNPVAWNRTIDNEGHYIEMGVTQNGSTAAVLGSAGQSVIDYHRIVRMETPAALGDWMEHFPVIHDYGGNARLVLPQNLYAYLGWSTGANLSAADAYIRLWYKEIELSSEDWYDLLQLRLPLGAL